MKTLSKPLLVYDGDSRYCLRLVAGWKALTGDKIDYEPYQRAAEYFPNLSPKDLQSSLFHFVDLNHEMTSGATAITRLLAYLPEKKTVLWIYRNLPFFATLRDKVLDFYSKHRQVLTHYYAFFHGRQVEPPTYRFSSSIFLVFLGFIYLIAFVSLSQETNGLLGSSGVLPVESFLKAVHANLGFTGYRLLPTFLWFSANDTVIQVLCNLGAFLSLALVVGYASSLLLFILWGLYLSLVVAGGGFLVMPWDNLLLEAGFLAIFLGNLTLPASTFSNPRPPRTVVWLFRWLLFRFFFTLGLSKLLSPDPAWRNLTGLSYYLETQPLPTVLAWWCHLLPAWLLGFLNFLMLVIEVAMPFLVFGPRRQRLWTCGAFAGYLVATMLTGNYSFFCLLGLGLCLFLVDDAVFPDPWHLSLGTLKTSKKTAASDNISKRWPRWAIAILTAVILWVSGLEVLTVLLPGWSLPAPLIKTLNLTAPFHSINSYDNFPVVPRTRREVLIQGSRNRSLWYTYEFLYKPGDPSRIGGPTFFSPVRLDWLVWYAAQSDASKNPWLVNLCLRLLDDSPEVVGLLRENPFKDAPPRHIRAALYDYRFSTYEEKRAEQCWWKRQENKLYFPIISVR